MIVQTQIIKYQDVELDITEVTLLSEDEYNNSKDVIPLVNRWWLRSPNDHQYFATLVDDAGLLDYFGISYDYGCVRPALRIRNPISFNINVGDKVWIAELLWTKISDDLLICDTFVGRSCFQKDFTKDKPNDYETSDVKKWLENWAKEKGLI